MSVCRNGHPVTPDNQYRRANGIRCKQCIRERYRRRARKTGPRYPMLPRQPLEQYLRTVVEDGSARVFAALCGVDRRVWMRWGAEGISLYAADRAAIALGLHPVLIWAEFHTVESAAA